MFSSVSTGQTVPLPLSSSSEVRLGLKSGVREGCSALLNECEELIRLSPDLPGNSGDVEGHRDCLLTCLNELRSEGVWSCDNNDVVNRPTVVGMQAIMENVLINRVKQNASTTIDMVVHTANPPTPLCTTNTEIEKLMHSDIACNQGCISTVRGREITNNEMLTHHSQVNYYALYGSERADKNQQQAFEDRCAKYTNLMAVKMHSSPDNEASGATYIIKQHDGSNLVLGIRMTQANVLSSKCYLFIDDNVNADSISSFLGHIRSYVIDGMGTMDKDSPSVRHLYDLMVRLS